MKKLSYAMLLGLTSWMLFTGCVGLQVGGGTTSRVQSPTLGQQLIDLQKARDAGIISDAEYQSQKAKLLGNK